MILCALWNLPPRGRYPSPQNVSLSDDHVQTTCASIRRNQDRVDISETIGSLSVKNCVQQLGQLKCLFGEFFHFVAKDRCSPKHLTVLSCALAQNSSLGAPSLPEKSIQQRGVSLSPFPDN